MTRAALFAVFVAGAFAGHLPNGASEESKQWTQRYEKEYAGNCLGLGDECVDSPGACCPDLHCGWSGKCVKKLSRPGAFAGPLPNGASEEFANVGAQADVAATVVV